MKPKMTASMAMMEIKNMTLSMKCLPLTRTSTVLALGSFQAMKKCNINSTEMMPEQVTEATLLRL